MCAHATTYALGDRVLLTYRNFDLATDEYLGKVTEVGKITRVWTNQKSVTIRTASGKTFVRQITSPELRKD